jgi:hypothetical protein
MITAIKGENHQCHCSFSPDKHRKYGDKLDIGCNTAMLQMVIKVF